MEDKDNIQVLVFHRDKEDKNWISRLKNGKIAILHRADTTTPQPNVPYLCKVDEKEKYAIAWIQSLYAYPRVIVTPPPRRYIYLESPGNKPTIYTDILSIFDAHDLEYLYVKYPKENRKEIDTPSTESYRDIEIDVRIKIGSESTLKSSFIIKRPRNVDAKTIFDEIKNKIK